MRYLILNKYGNLIAVCKFLRIVDQNHKVRLIYELEQQVTYAGRKLIIALLNLTSLHLIQECGNHRF